MNHETSHEILTSLTKGLKRKLGCEDEDNLKFYRVLYITFKS